LEVAAAISDYAPSTDRPGKLIAKEILAGISTVLLFPFGIRRQSRRTPRLADQRTIVFVHGYLSNPSCFLPLSLYLRSRGFDPPLSFSYSGSIGVEQAALKLREFLRRQVRGGRVDLVCHSLGGLVARVYLQELGGTRRVDSCVTLGTPHRGTYNAYWLWSRVGRELRPDSGVLARLSRSQNKAASVRFLSVVAGSDNIVVPRIFAQGADETFFVPEVGHLGLLYSPRVYRKIGDYLTRLKAN